MTKRLDFAMARPSPELSTRSTTPVMSTRMAGDPRSSSARESTSR
jgi:hypothetical protein